MKPIGALLELLARVGANQGTPILVSEKELASWPVAAVRVMKSQSLLVQASPATSVICPGCEQECVMPVYCLPAGKRPVVWFTVCDKRDDINRVPVPAEQLRQWRCASEDVSAFVAQSLGLRPTTQRKTTDGLWELGILTGRKRSQMLCLRANGDLELLAGNNAVPLTELLRYESACYAVDVVAAKRLVDAATTADSRYTPSTARRETRKLETLATYKAWKSAYRTLKKSRPDMSDVWYSQQIAKLCSNGRSADTIRKHMK